MKARRIRWAGHIGCMGRHEMHMNCLSANLKGRERGRPEKITLEWALKK
jgi:hypothetical protein